MSDDYANSPTDHWRARIYGDKCAFCGTWSYQHDALACRDQFVAELRATRALVREEKADAAL